MNGKLYARERRDISVGCVELQLSFGQSESRPRERPLSSDGISHLTGGKAILTEGKPLDGRKSQPTGVEFF